MSIPALTNGRLEVPPQMPLTNRFHIVGHPERNKGCFERIRNWCSATFFGKATLECPSCYEPITESDALTRNISSHRIQNQLMESQSDTGYKHFLHTKCVVEWLQNSAQAKCPGCNVQMNDDYFIDNRPRAYKKLEKGLQNLFYFPMNLKNTLIGGLGLTALFAVATRTIGPISFLIPSFLKTEKPIPLFALLYLCCGAAAAGACAQIYENTPNISKKMDEADWLRVANFVFCFIGSIFALEGSDASVQVLRNQNPHARARDVFKMTAANISLAGLACFSCGGGILAFATLSVLIAWAAYLRD